MQPAGQARRATIGYLVYKATTKTWFLKLSHDHVAEISIQGVTYVYLGPIKAFYFMLFSMPGTINYHRFESFGQITVELHKKNSVERDKAFLFLEISFELSSQFVYKIPYRRARAWPSGCFRPSASREQRYLAYKKSIRRSSRRLYSLKIKLIFFPS